MYDTDSLGYPVMLDQGVRCGNHRYGPGKTYHQNVEAVRACYAITREQEAQQKAELAAELRNEQWFENRGWDEARAQEDWEASRGVIPFDEAMRQASNPDGSWR